MLLMPFLDGSWFLPHQPMYASAAQMSPCQFRSSPTLKRQKSAPYTIQRQKSASVSPPPHGKLFSSNLCRIKVGLYYSNSNPDDIRSCSYWFICRCYVFVI